MKRVCTMRLLICFSFMCFMLVVVSENVQYEKLCANPDCSEPISLATGKLKYDAISQDSLSYRRGEKLKIFSKAVDKDEKWGKWEAEVDEKPGKRGLVSPHIIIENHVYKTTKDLVKVLTTAGIQKDITGNAKEEETSLRPDVIVTHAPTILGGVAAEVGDGGPPVSPYDVVDGTTLYHDTGGSVSIQATSTQRSLKTEIPTVPAVDPSNIDTSSPPKDTSKVLADDNVEDDQDDVDEEEDYDGDDEEEDDTEEELEEVDSTETSTAPSPTAAPFLSQQQAPEQTIDELDSPLTEDLPPPSSLNSTLEIIDSLLKTDKPSSHLPPVIPGQTNSPEIGLLHSSVDNIQLKQETPVEATKTPSENPTSGDAPGDIHHLSGLEENVVPAPPHDGSPSSDKPSNPPDLATSTPAPLDTPPIQLVPDQTPASIPKTHSENVTPYMQEQASTDILTSTEGTVRTASGAPSVLPDVLPPESNNTGNEFQASSAQQMVVTESLEEKDFTTEPPSQTPMPRVPPPPEFSLSSVDSEESPMALIPSPITPQESFPHKENFPPTPHEPSIPSPSASFSSPDPNTDSSALQNPPEATAELPLPLPPQPQLYPGLFPKSDPIRPSEATPTEDEIKPASGLGSVEIVTPQIPPEVPEPTDEEGITEESESPGIFSGLTGLFSGLFGSSESSEEEDLSVPALKEVLTQPSEQFVAPTPIPQSPSLESEAVPVGECKTVRGLESDCADAPSPPHLLEFFEKTVPETSYTFLYLVVTSVTVLIFTLGYYFIERTRQDGPLIAKVNNLTHELQVATSQLEARNRTAQDSLVMSEANNEVLTVVQAEVNDLKRSKALLESQLESQQQELDAATEAGLELNRMLTDLLAQQQGSDSLLKSVEELQGQLNVQQQVIDDMNRSLVEKSQENEALQVEHASSLEKIENLEEELNDMRQNLNMHLKEKETMMWELETRNAKLEDEMAAMAASKAAEIAALSKAVADLTEKGTIRDSEYRALSETIEELRKRGDVDPTALYDVGHVKAELARAVAEKETLKERLSEEEGARKLLEDHVKSVDEEVSDLRSSFEIAEKEKIEAETRLTVLSNYFKEKETHLQKELGLQEAMWVQKQGDDTTVYERIKSFQEEVESYKAQTEMLKKEIIDQERGLKGQIATLEKKAHENWVAARQAERRLEESKQEAGQLRNMLTLMEKTSGPEGETKPVPRHPAELNGEDSLPPLLPDGTSPLPLPPLPLDSLGPPPMLPPGFMPPPFMHPPGGFIPPPFHPGDRRPPPLGRMSSPPLNRFSPQPGDFGYDRMSPPLSPPVRSYRSPPDPRSPPPHWDEPPPPRGGFRPVASQRDSRRNYQGSNLSSGNSSSESLDKPTRRGKV